LLQDEISTLKTCKEIGEKQVFEISKELLLSKQKEASLEI
jgi:hypothetical protein